MFRRFLMAALFVMCISSISFATPISFDVAGGSGGSSVSISDVSTLGWTSLTGSLVSGLDSTQFTLLDGDSFTFDFFTLTASGLGLGDATVSATLAFDSPLSLLGSGSGSAEWGTFFGLVSGGVLTWSATTLPDYVTLADGTVLSVNFENGVELGLGDTATVHATVSNLGGPAPVPEPSTLLLLGVGVAGLAFYRRKKNA